VVWGDATGAVLGTTTTGAEGVATSALPNAATVTVLLGTALAPSLYSVMGLHLGETLLVADVKGAVDSTLTVNLASVPTAPALDDGGADSYVASVGTCTQSFSAPPESIALGTTTDDQPCSGGSVTGGSYAAEVPVLVEAQDSNGTPFGYTFVTNDPVGTAIDAGVLNVATASSWSTTLPAQTLSVAESNAGVTAQITYSELADGVLTPLAQHTPSSFDAGLGAAALVYTHPGFAAAVQAEAYFPNGGDLGAAGTTIVAAALPPTTSGTLTLDPSPVGAAPTFTSVGVTLGAQPVVTWALKSGTLSASTGIIAVTNWNGDIGDGGTQQGTWTIVSPGTAGSSLTAPALPGSLQAYAPVAGAGENNTMVFAIDGQTAIPSFASLLTVASLYQVYSDVCNTFSPSVPPLPGLGSAVISFLSDENGC
jgi:hypothetical protein